MFPQALLLFALCLVVASAELLDRRPELGHFQHLGEIFPLQGTWLMKYRSHINDPFFGGNAKCVRGHQVGPLEGDTTKLRVFFNPDVEVVAKVTLISTKGYTHKNVLRMATLKAPEQPGDLEVVYSNPSSCAVFRHVYVSDNACSMVVKEDHRHGLNRDCDYAFALFCGSHKNIIDDESCKH